MYDKLIHSLGSCLLKNTHLLLHGNLEPGSKTLSSVYLFTQKMDIIFFLTDFQNKNFIRKWCNQHKEEAEQFSEMASELARDLESFKNSTMNHGSSMSAQIAEKLSLYSYIFGKMISDMRE